MNTRSTLSVWVTCVTLMSAGCGGSSGPELVEVHGTVLLDGKPLSGASIRFVPELQGAEAVRPASGVTDDDGRYELEYSSSRSGALPGRYKVLITTARAPDEDEEGNPTPAAPETVPDVYNINSTLTADVGPDKDEFDFKLESSAGKIVQLETGEESFDPGDGE
jgi:hypothetical protein